MHDSRVPPEARVPQLRACGTLRRVEYSGPVVDPDPGSRSDYGPPSPPDRSLTLPARRAIVVVAVLMLAVLAGWWLTRDRGPWSFKIYVVEAGVYRVTYDELKAAGLAARSIRSTDIALSHRGAEVPIWVADGGDGRFGAGDAIEFVGEHLVGDRSYYNEQSMLNVYRLVAGGAEGLRMSAPVLPEADAREAEPEHLEVEAHWEENNFLVHFVARGHEAPEPRFWARLTHIDPEPFQRGGFWLGRSRAGARPVSLTAELRGWSKAGSKKDGLPDHRAEVYFNGTLVGSGEWYRQERHLVEVPEVPAELLAREGANTIEIKIPRRQPEGATDPLIDVVMLNWIKVRFPPPEAHSTLGGTWIPDQPQRLVLPPADGVEPAGEPPAAAKVRLATAAGGRLVVYGAGGSRFDEGNTEVEDHEGSTLTHFYPPPEESVFWAVPTGALRAPVAVELDHPSALKDPSRRADYIMIAHPRLLEAILPLAAFHRRRGLEVEVVAVDDVYDEFNDGVLHPRAIRDFLSYAYHHWQRPAPRFVLLAGDASWDAEGTGSIYNGGAPYPRDEPLTHRNLVPTSVFDGFMGHTASDNSFVAIDGDDHLPDMAIGRFPVAEPEEVRAIVDKILHYGEEVGVGPWRRNMLWLSDVTSLMQERSDNIAAGASTQGFAVEKIYPNPDQPSDEQSQDPLRQAFDRGQVLVHFFGHGARYVWRTGTADHRGNFDLFGLEHLNELEPNDKTPLVLSMTCWSAPFDHPTADSIGENFLRLEGRGAVAFLGASWKVSPNQKFSDLLIEELTSPGTIGEAIMRAKRRLKARSLIENYNLLGDPATELALPQHPLALEASATGEGAFRIVANLPEALSAGRAIVDWLDEAGNAVHSDPLEVEGGRLEVDYQPDGDAAGVATARVYVWNEEARVDALGAVELVPDEET